MEKVTLKVEGMSCANCALTIDQYLKEKNLQNVKVHFIGGEVSFELNDSVTQKEIEKGIEALGYYIKDELNEAVRQHYFGILPFKSHLQRFWFCLVFTLPLILAMIPGSPIHMFMNPYAQLIVTIPVYIVGMDFFGRSAIKSLSKGIPNMNVLIALGSSAAFGYSIYGILAGRAAEFLFFETACTTITLVFLGNWMEDASIEKTQTELKKLIKSQKVMANMIAFDDEHKELVFPVENTGLHIGDLILIKSGEQVPMDCKILWGEALVNEAIITGESAPLEKKMKDLLIGGSILESGTVKAQVTTVGEDTVLSNILKMVQDAQLEKPPVQQMADKISAIFVPVVVSIAIITIAMNYFIADKSFGESLLRSIAVLVIACPCAMGLATPAAVAVGLGRAAKSGVLFKNAKSLEIFKDIKQVVFDKTGTLTTGNFIITNYKVCKTESVAIQSDVFNSLTTSNNANLLQATPHEDSCDVQSVEDDFKRIAYSLEKYSSHPIARCIVKEWKSKEEVRWVKIEEIKGMGMKGTDKEGNEYIAGSFKAAAAITKDATHNIYIICNKELIGWIDVADEIRSEAQWVVSMLKSKGIKTILLSGDRREKCEQVAQALGIEEVISEQTPSQKLEKIAAYNLIAPTAMVGDGINDAPALAKATVGISLSDASQVAMQHAQVVLMNYGLKNLPLALGLGKHTYLTIKGNLFWAFAYNIVAIPVAAFGFLSPTFGALVMGLSDVVLAANSIRLNWKKVV